MEGVTAFFSLSTSMFPNSHSLLSQVKVPLSVTLQPLIESSIPHVSYGTEPVVRCHSCNGYISPFTSFTHEGHVWVCSLCASLNKVPDFFYAPLTEDGQRTDKSSHSELSSLAYDILAPEDYMLRPPMPPTYCFVVDISQASRACGMMDSVCEVVESLIDQQAFPGLPRTQVSFILFGHEVHLLSFSGDNGPVTIHSMSKAADEQFLPVPKDQLLVSLADNESSAKKCVQLVRKLSTDSCLESSALRLALIYAKLVLGDSGGKLLTFLGESNAEDSLPLKTETPVNSLISFYREIASELTANAISCDLYVAASRHCSLYSMGDLARYTSGKVFFYPELEPSQRIKLKNELWASITRETVWEASLRIRVNRDWKLLQAYGHYHIRTSDLLSLPTLDSTQTITLDLGLAATLVSVPHLHIQGALLYTTSDGDRRIRVMNHRVALTDQLADVYRSADAECVAGCWAKQALFRLLESSRFESAKDYMQQQLAALTSSYDPYRSVDSQHLQFLPALVLGYMKLPAFNGQSAGYHLDFDAACWQRYLLASMAPRSLSLIAYPRLYPVHQLLSAEDQLLPVALSRESLSSEGIYLLDSGWDFLLWIGHEAGGPLLTSLFGRDTFDGILYPNESNLSHSQSPFTDAFHAFLTSLRLEVGLYQLLRIVKSKDALESLLTVRLVEDQTRVGPSLESFIQQIAFTPGQ